MRAERWSATPAAASDLERSSLHQSREDDASKKPQLAAFVASMQTSEGDDEESEDEDADDDDDEESDGADTDGGRDAEIIECTRKS